MLGWKEDRTKEYYWAVVIEPGSVQAGIWEIVGSKAEAVSISSPAVWETDKELIEATDTALSSSVQTFPEDFKEPSKAVFGVPTSWVEKGQIKEENLTKIKNICTDLSLEPTGFVVLPEAIAHFLKVEEGIPPNAAIVGVGKDYLEIAVFKSGVLTGNTAVARSVSFFEDIIEGFCRFSTSENPPSRIVIYNNKEGELEEIKQLLVSSEWEGQEKLKFLHPPKIEILTSDKKVLATALAGASEIGAVALVEPESAPSAQELGFVMGEDVAAKPEAQTFKTPPAPATPVKKEFSKFHWPKFRLPKFYLPRMFGSKSVVAAGILISAAILFFAFGWLYPKAEVKIYVNPKRFEEKTEISIDLGVSSADLDKMIIPGKAVSVQVAGEKTKSTTGTKKIGDKTKGTVNIQNGMSAILDLAAGTILTSANGLKYGTVLAASVSAALSPVDPGTQTVEIAAADIGAEYNLAKDEIFKVGSYPKADVDAIATADLTGGSSREISAVSADDAKSLLDSLTDELTGQAKKNLSAEAPLGGIFIDESLTATASSKVFSSKVGDEASNLKLSLGLKASALVAAKDDLVALAKKILAGSAPSGFRLNENNLGFNFTRLEANLFSLKIAADFLPDEDLAALTKKILGKNSSTVETEFSSIPGFSRAEINIEPRFLNRLRIVPLVSKNVSVKITSER